MSDDRMDRLERRLQLLEEQVRELAGKRGIREAGREAGTLRSGEPERQPRRPAPGTGSDTAPRVPSELPRFPAFPLPRCIHNNIPAIVADKKFANVPASIARIPSWARSRFRSGTSAPIPPS